MKSISKWDERFLGLAEHISSWSKDPSTKVGAVIVDSKNRVVSLGYNGFPCNIDDNENRLNDRDTKLNLTVHGEINAILFANKSVENCTLYTFPFGPCIRCATQIIQSGLRRIVFPKTTIERWIQSINDAKALFREAGVEYHEVS